MTPRWVVYEDSRGFCLCSATVQPPPQKPLWFQHRLEQKRACRIRACQKREEAEPACVLQEHWFTFIKTSHQFLLSTQEDRFPHDELAIESPFEHVQRCMKGVIFSTTSFSHFHHNGRASRVPHITRSEPCSTGKTVATDTAVKSALEELGIQCPLKLVPAQSGTRQPFLFFACNLRLA